MGLNVNVLAAMGRHDPLTTSRGAAEGALRPGPHDTPRQPLTRTSCATTPPHQSSPTKRDQHNSSLTNCFEDKMNREMERTQKMLGT